MNQRETIFLTLQEAVAAVCIDFRRYEPQVMLFSEILRLVSGGKAVIKQDGEGAGRWVAAEPGKKMVWLDGQALCEYVCRVLLSRDLKTDLMVPVCARVFQARAFPGTDPMNGRAGVTIETGMEEFVCRQCGNCCRILDYHDAVTAADVTLWERSGRQDILDRVGVFQRSGSEPAFRIWVEPETGNLAKKCPFLKHLPAEKRWICGIHDIKPRICREYPVSRKHGLMTGCPGFSVKGGT